MAAMKILLVVIVALVIAACAIDAVAENSAAIREGRVEHLSPEDKAALCVTAVRVQHGIPTRVPAGRSGDAQEGTGFQEGHYNETLARLLNCTVNYDMLSGITHHYKTIHTPGHVRKNTYKVYTEFMSWNAAYSQCASEGAHLAIINSKFEASALRTMYAQIAPQSRNNYLLVGVMTVPTTDTWLTILGESLDRAGFNSWYSGNPNNTKGDENCAAMNFDNQLADIQCNTSRSSYPFICEREDTSC